MLVVVVSVEGVRGCAGADAGASLPMLLRRRGHRTTRDLTFCSSRLSRSCPSICWSSSASQRSEMARVSTPCRSVSARGRWWGGGGV